MKKEIRDGKVAVLYSPGYGAGWSTWTMSSDDDIIFDPSIVYMVEEMNKAYDDEDPSLYESWVDNIKAYCEKTYPDMYTGGIDQLHIAWIPEGTLFRIDEYDGSESIEYKENEWWIKA